MLLQFNHHSIKATEIMSKWPKHPNNPYKGYVGHPLLVKLGYHQTIFPAAFVPFSSNMTIVLKMVQVLA